jgi:hypothetical protein
MVHSNYILLFLLLSVLSQKSFFVESACVKTTTTPYIPTPVTANQNRSELCEDRFGPCVTFYNSDCVCVGQNMSIPYFSLSWAVQYIYLINL